MLLAADQDRWTNPFFPQLIKAVMLGARRPTSISCPRPGGTLAAVPEKIPARDDPGTEQGARQVHHGLTAQIHADTPLDPISRLEITSKCVATTKREKKDTHERITWEKSILDLEGASCLSEV